MEAIRRGINGKRLFTPELKREQVGRVVRGEVSAAELGRELGISPGSSVAGSTWSIAAHAWPSAPMRSWYR